MHRQIAALIDRQAGWTEPLADRVQPVLERLLNERRPVKSILNGTWFGHPVHPLLTDVPTGAMTVAVLLDAAGQDAGADIAVAAGIAGMAASAVTGAADAVDAYGRPRSLATVHATLMVGSLSAYALSLLLRLGPRAGRPLARLLALAGYGTLTAGAYVGGDLVFRAGHQVDRHAFESSTSKWRPLDVAEVPPGKLVRAKAGPDAIVLYRAAEGDPLIALSAVCAHEGGPLDKGTVADGCIECPWHRSRFEIATGRVRQGPAVYDQPRFEVREADGGGLEARRA
jgi:nitrite reductase/ring-hydroxylating ferredoxin subunit/uncharacterized membrane protein